MTRCAFRRFGISRRSQSPGHRPGDAPADPQSGNATPADFATSGRDGARAPADHRLDDRRVYRSAPVRRSDRAQKPPDSTPFLRRAAIIGGAHQRQVPSGRLPAAFTWHQHSPSRFAHRISASGGRREQRVARSRPPSRQIGTGMPPALDLKISAGLPPPPCCSPVPGCDRTGCRYWPRNWRRVRQPTILPGR